MFGHGLYGFGGPLMMVLFWGAIIAGVFFLVRYSFHTGGGKGCGCVDSALGILEKRFANGEIDSDEYEKRKKVLSGEG